MESFQRSQVITLVHRLAEAPHRLITLFGPAPNRQNHHRAPGAWEDRPQKPLPGHRRTRLARVPRPIQCGRCNLLVATGRDTDWLVQNWENARRKAEQSGGFVLVFDEIQKISRWSETVKGLWDADRARNCPLHVVILGSAPLLMQSGLAESLGGRFEPIRVTHWSFDEMSAAFGFDLLKYLYFGGYPGAARYIRDLDRWRNYVLGALVEPTIERDLLSMTRVNKPALLKQLFELGAAYSGQILSYTKMLGQLQDAGNTTTLAHYLDLLSSAGLLAGIQKYSNQPHRRKGSIPKLSVLNTALMTAGSGYSFDEAKADRSFWGRIVESAVGAHLFNTATSDIQLHYWRAGSLEVDFVLQCGFKLIPIEVKSGAKTMRLQGMDEFRQRFHPPSSLLVGEGGIPLDEFLTVSAHQWFEEI